MANSRVARGRATQGVLAAYFQQHGWEGAEPVWGSQPGRDITGMPGLAPEVKATRDMPLLGALRQAEKNAKDDLPFVVWRPDGRGPEKIDIWVAAFDLKNAVMLLKEAGY